MSNEPARTVGYITALIAAIFGLLAAFGVGIPVNMQDSVQNVAATLVPVLIVVTEIIRSKVTPAKKVAEIVKEAQTALIVSPRPTAPLPPPESAAPVAPASPDGVSK